MPFETRLEDRCVYARYFGVVTFDDVMQSSAKSWGDPEWEYLESYISDFLDVEKLDMTAEDARALAFMNNAALEKRTQYRKYALVAANPQAIELIRIYLAELQAPDWDVQMFEEMEPALDWVASSRQADRQRTPAGSLSVTTQKTR